MSLLWICGEMFYMWYVYDDHQIIKSLLSFPSFLTERGLLNATQQTQETGFVLSFSEETLNTSRKWMARKKIVLWVISADMTAFQHCPLTVFILLILLHSKNSDNACNLVSFVSTQILMTVLKIPYCLKNLGDLSVVLWLTYELPCPNTFYKLFKLVFNI